LTTTTLVLSSDPLLYTIDQKLRLRQPSTLKSQLQSYPSILSFVPDMQHHLHTILTCNFIGLAKNFGL
jgi:DNA-binding transcriptional regulator/RsmH inhibitor MraZ